MGKSMTAEFIVVRHGETEENLQGIIQGQRDTKLNDLGLRQAHCVAERLKSVKLDSIFSSDLSRAMITAETIARYHHLPVVGLRALREWDLGDLQGRPLSELRDNDSRLMSAFKCDIGDLQIPGGESRSVFYQRVADCLDELALRFPGKRILLVSHGGTIRSMFHHIAGPVPASSRLPLTSNTGVSSFRYDNGCWQLTSWNDVSHLRSLGENESVIF